MADNIYTTQVATEVIETNDSSSYATRVTQVSAEVIESNSFEYNIRASQVAIEVIITRYDIAPRFIGWGVPLA